MAGVTRRWVITGFAGSFASTTTTPGFAAVLSMRPTGLGGSTPPAGKSWAK
jgi:hypothetical protein